MESPRIYGAGLLSSIGESQSCLKPEVEKLAYGLEAANRGFDITKPQPQLYVTPSFAHLMEVLEEFADTLSVRTGGWKGLEKLIESGMVGTIELSTGLQISGSFDRMILDDEKNVVYFETKGPSALAYREKELIGHGTDRYPAGFRSPLGKLKSINLAIEDMGPVDLAAYGFLDGEWLSFKYESGVEVEGQNVTGIRSVEGKLLVIQMVNCTVRYRDEILYAPDRGVFDMAIGKDILSAFAGSADYHSFPNLYHESSTTSTSKVDANLDERHRLYKFAGQRNATIYQSDPDFKRFLDEVETHCPDEWLLIWECLCNTSREDQQSALISMLEAIELRNPHLAQLIANGRSVL